MDISMEDCSKIKGDIKIEILPTENISDPFLSITEYRFQQQIIKFTLYQCQFLN